MPEKRSLALVKCCPLFSSAVKDVDSVQIQNDNFHSVDLSILRISHIRQGHYVSGAFKNILGFQYSKVLRLL